MRQHVVRGGLGCGIRYHYQPTRRPLFSCSSAHRSCFPDSRAIREQTGLVSIDSPASGVKEVR